jgi:hypothetical protein
MKKIIHINMDNVLVDIHGIDGMRNIHGARESLKRLSYDYDVFIYSAAAYDARVTWRAKTEWILNNFGDDAVRNLTLTHDKYVPIGDFLIIKEKEEFVVFQGRHLQFKKGDFENWECIVDYFDSARLNPLLSICRLAAERPQCLRLTCFCGGDGFRRMLLRISSGDIPVKRWLHAPSSEFEYDPHLPFTLEQKHNILSICEEVNIEKLAESTAAASDNSFSSNTHFLMCLGILLHQMSRSEDLVQGYTAEYKSLSNILCAKLLTWVGDKDIEHSEWLTRLIDNPNYCLTWEDLERFE